MERDVVLGEEVVGFCGWVGPPFLPSRGGMLHFRPFFACGEVPDDRIEPDVDAFGFEAEDRDLDAPADVAGDRAVLQTAGQPVVGELQDVGLPECLVLEPALQLAFEAAEGEEEVLGLLFDGGAAAEFAADGDEVTRVKEFAAVVALIPACLRVVAVGAGAFDVAVW